MKKIAYAVFIVPVLLQGDDEESALESAELFLHNADLSVVEEEFLITEEQYKKLLGAIKKEKGE